MSEQLPKDVVWLRRIYADKLAYPSPAEWKDDYIARVVAHYNPAEDEKPFLESAADKAWDDEAMASVALEYDFDE